MKARLAAFRERHRVVAVGGATLDIDGRIDAEIAGVTRRGGTETVGISDAWHIGSCAKSLTAALYARLVEQGRAAWGSRLTELFPDLAGSVHHGWSVATIDDLFLCRSGLPANPTRKAMSMSYLDRRPAIVQRSAATHDALADPPHGHSRFRYSNLGFVVAGAAIDRLGGQPFESLLRTEILDPLGVTTAGLGPPPRICGHRPRLRIGGLCLGSGEPVDTTDIRSDNPPLLTPAGRLHLSLPDWARVQRLFFLGADGLTPASLDHLLRLPPDGRGMAMGWAAARGLPGIALGMQGSNTAWAATALMTDDRRQMAMVVANDGRTSMLRHTALLAAELLRARSR